MFISFTGLFEWAFDVSIEKLQYLSENWELSMELESLMWIIFYSVNSLLNFGVCLVTFQNILPVVAGILIPWFQFQVRMNNIAI
jgi:hypothetical protein